jgi:hypothetical protein
MLLRINKQGVSVMIEYVLLVTVAIIMGALVYAWIKSYVPTETLACPDGVSMAVSDFKYDCANSLNITIKNTGRFSLAGYFIRAANSSGQDLAAIDLGSALNSNFGGYSVGSEILFHQEGGNSLLPDNSISQTFQIPAGTGKIYFIELTAARYQTQDNKDRFVTCSDSTIKQEFIC